MLKEKTYIVFFWIFWSFPTFGFDSYITKSVGVVPFPLVLEDGTLVALPLNAADSTQGDLLFIKEGIETNRIRIDTIPEEKRTYFKKLQAQAQIVARVESSDLNFFQKMWKKDKLEGLWAWPRYLKYDYEVFGSLMEDAAFSRSRHTLAFSLGHPYFSVGGDIVTAKHHGSLYSDVLREYSGVFGALGWGLSISFPIVRYELRKHNFILPEYGWLESKLDSLFTNKKKGSIVSLYGQNLQDSTELKTWSTVCLFACLIYSTP